MSKPLNCFISTAQNCSRSNRQLHIIRSLLFQCHTTNHLEGIYGQIKTQMEKNEEMDKEMMGKVLEMINTSERNQLNQTTQMDSFQKLSSDVASLIKTYKDNLKEIQKTMKLSDEHFALLLSDYKEIGYSMKIDVLKEISSKIESFRDRIIKISSESKRHPIDTPLNNTKTGSFSKGQSSKFHLVMTKIFSRFGV